MRAFGTEGGRKSRSHISGPPLAFHEPKACPDSPVTAIILENGQFYHHHAAEGDSLYCWALKGGGQRREPEEIFINKQPSGSLAEFALQRHFQVAKRWG